MKLLSQRRTAVLLTAAHSPPRAIGGGEFPPDAGNGRGKMTMSWYASCFNSSQTISIQLAIRSHWLPVVAVFLTLLLQRSLSNVPIARLEAQQGRCGCLGAVFWGWFWSECLQTVQDLLCFLMKSPSKSNGPGQTSPWWILTSNKPRRFAWQL